MRGADKQILRGGEMLRAVSGALSLAGLAVSARARVSLAAGGRSTRPEAANATSGYASRRPRSRTRIGRGRSRRSPRPREPRTGFPPHLRIACAGVSTAGEEMPRWPLTSCLPCSGQFADTHQKLRSHAILEVRSGRSQPTTSRDRVRIDQRPMIFPGFVRIKGMLEPHEVNGQPDAIFLNRDGKVLRPWRSTGGSRRSAR